MNASRGALWALTWAADEAGCGRRPCRWCTHDRRAGRRHAHVDHLRAAGYTVVRSLGLSWGLIVRSVGLTKGLTGTVRSLKAGEVKEFTVVVDQARHTALERLIDHARQLGGNAARPACTAPTSPVDPVYVMADFIPSAQGLCDITGSSSKSSIQG